MGASADTGTGRPIGGIVSGRNLPARMSGCSAANGTPALCAWHTFSGAQYVPIGFDWKSLDVLARRVGGEGDGRADRCRHR